MASNRGKYPPNTEIIEYFNPNDCLPLRDIERTYNVKYDKEMDGAKAEAYLKLHPEEGAFILRPNSDGKVSLSFNKRENGTMSVVHMPFNLVKNTNSNVNTFLSVPNKTTGSYVPLPELINHCRLLQAADITDQLKKGPIGGMRVQNVSPTSGANNGKTAGVVHYKDMDETVKHIYCENKDQFAKAGKIIDALHKNVDRKLAEGRLKNPIQPQQPATPAVNHANQRLQSISQHFPDKIKEYNKFLHGHDNGSIPKNNSNYSKLAQMIQYTQKNMQRVVYDTNNPARKNKSRAKLLKKIGEYNNKIDVVIKRVTALNNNKELLQNKVNQLGNVLNKSPNLDQHQRNAIQDVSKSLSNAIAQIDSFLKLDPLRSKADTEAATLKSQLSKSNTDFNNVSKMMAASPKPVTPGRR